MSVERLQRLSEIVQCLRCRSRCRPDARGGLSCVNCEAFYPLQRDVLWLDAQRERPEVLAEREGVVQTEQNSALGGINDRFDDLANAQGALRDAILSLPGGNGSHYYTEPGYFLNVRNSRRGFDFVRARLDGRQGGRLLDVGGDLTWSTNYFAHQGYACTAIDVNHHLQVGALFQQAFGRPYDMVRVDMCANAFAPKSFDAIVAFNALHHAGELEQVSANLARSLKPGGRLAAVEPYCVSLEQKHAFGRAQAEAGINEHTYLLDEWHAALTGAGLVLVEVMVADACNMIYRKPEPGEHVDTQGTMLERAHAGRLAVLDVRPSSSSRQLIARLQVSNEGNAVWCSEGSLPVFVSYHLDRRVDGARASIKFDNARTAIPDVLPGASISCEVVVDLPAESGDYEVTFDLVQEGLLWFAQKGFIGDSIVAS